MEPETRVELGEQEARAEQAGPRISTIEQMTTRVEPMDQVNITEKMTTTGQEVMVKQRHRQITVIDGL